MAASYPSSVKSFTPIVDAVDYPQATQLNQVYDEVTAMQQAMLSTGLAHHLLFVDATYDIGQSGATRPRHLFMSGNATIGGTLALTGVATLTAQAVLTAGFKTTSGNCYVGDDANAGMTLGLTINQGANDDEIVALKSSDVAHGITDSAETDTYGALRKTVAASGGLECRGLTEDGIGVAVVGHYTNDITTKGTSNAGAVYINVAKKSGAGTGAPGADANLMAIAANATTRFIFDNEGSAHADVEWTTFDTHDDLALLDTLDRTMHVRDAVTNAFGDVLRYNADALQAAGIVNFYDDGPRAMVNFTRLAMLHTGALRQIGRQIQAMTQALLAAGVVTPAQLEAR